MPAIFIKTKDQKYHISDLYQTVMHSYHGYIHEGIEPWSVGRVWCRQVDLPEHIKLCGVCLRYYHLGKEKGT